MNAMNDIFLPIKIRQDVVVRVFDLPLNLTKAEADKISRVIMSHVEETGSNGGN